MEENGVWRVKYSVEYGKYGLFPLVEYESESGVNVGIQYTIQLKCTINDL